MEVELNVGKLNVTKKKYVNNVNILHVFVLLLIWCSEVCYFESFLWIIYSDTVCMRMIINEMKITVVKNIKIVIELYIQVAFWKVFQGLFSRSKLKCSNHLFSIIRLPFSALKFSRN